MATAIKQLSDQMVEPTARSYPISIEHVTKSYGDTTVVDDLSFVVEPGRVTGFLGPNGAGKSTTMKILLGLASPTSGQATIGGLAYGELSDPTGTVGASVESDAFHPGRSGRNHLRILADATVDNCCAKRKVLAVAAHAVRDLGRQFARRGEYESPDTASIDRAILQTLQHRQCETRGFAGARLGARKNITTFENEGDSLLLDRGRLLVTLIVDRTQQFGRKA